MKIKIGFGVALLAFLSSVAAAQTISPLSAEFKKHASGSFTATNNSVVPVIIVAEPVTFHQVNGQQVTEALPSSIHIELSESSARLAPKTSREIFYKMTCDTEPCAAAIYVRFTGPHTDTGVSVALHLPTSIYICPDTTKKCRERIRASWASLTK